MPVIPIAFASAVVRFACCSTTESCATRFTGESAAARSAFAEATDVERGAGPGRDDADAAGGRHGEARVDGRVLDAPRSCRAK